MWLGPLSQAADLAIFAAYVAIPIILLVALNRSRLELGAAQKRSVLLLAAFILSCGITHANAFIAFWHPWYMWEAVAKAATALISFAWVWAAVRAFPDWLGRHSVALRRHQRGLAAMREAVERDTLAPVVIHLDGGSDLYEPPGDVPGLRILRRVLGWSVVGIAGLVLIGWLTHSRTLVQIIPGAAPMQPATAIGFLLLGWKVAKPNRRVGAAVLILGAWIVLGVYTPLPGPGAILPAPWLTDMTASPGEPAPNTGLCFLLCGLAYQARRTAWLASALIFASWAIALWSFSGYAAKWSSAYGWHVGATPMAVHTAIAFLLATFGQILAHVGGRDVE